MWPTHITMSSVDFLHELDVFTTRVKTKTVPVLGYSTSNVIVQHKSLRRNLIPCQLLLLIFFIFLLYLSSSFLLHELDRKSQKKRQIFEKFLCCEYGLGGHGELANHRYNRHIGLKPPSTWKNCTGSEYLWFWGSVNLHICGNLKLVAAK